MLQYTIVGISTVSFIGQDKQQVEGKSIFLTSPLEGKEQEYSTEKIFLSSKKFKNMNFEPTVGHVVEILYNKFGKVETLRQVDELDYDIGIKTK